MKNEIANAGSSLALALALTVTGTAHAQTAGAPEAPASPAAAEGAQFDELIVTARRKEERLQGIPASVSAITGDDVGRMDSLADIQQLVSGVTFQTLGPIPAVGIRGFGNRTLAGNPSNSAIGIFEDGVFVLPALSTVINRTDTARVEIAKGPQGTLYGRSSFAGAFNIVTADPGDEYSGYLDAGYGFSSVEDDQLWRLQGAVSIPFSDTLSVRLYGLGESRDGFVHDSVTGNHSGGYDRQVGRVKFLWEPTEGFAARLSATVMRDDLPFPFVTAGRARPPLGRQVLFANPISPGSAAALRFGTSVWDGTLVTQPKNKIEGEQVTLDLRIDTPLGELASLTDYQDARLDPSFSLDNTRLAWAVGSSPYYENRISQELRLSNTIGQVSYLVGAYVLDSDVEQGGGKFFDLSKPFATFGPGSAQFDLANFAALYQPSYTKTKAYAVFGQLGFDFTEALNLTVGLRYGEDQIEGTAGTAFRTRTGVLIPTAPITFRSATFDAITGSANLSYKLSEDVTLYGSYARGNSPGGLNTGAFALRNFDEQSVDAYEIGFKSRLFDRRLQLNLAAFENRYSDLQLAQNVIAAGQLTSFVSNAGEARGRGYDVDVQALLSDHFRVGLQYTNVDSEITSYTPAAPPVLQVNLTGVPLVRSPEHSLNASATFFHDIGPGEFQITVSGNYSSSYTNDYQGVPAGFAYPGIPGQLPPGVTTSQVLGLYRIKPYETFNIDASYEWGNWEAGASVRNVLDNQYITAALAFDTVSVPLETPGAPRTVEVGLKYKF